MSIDNSLHQLEMEQDVFHSFDGTNTNFSIILNLTKEDDVSYNISIDPVTEMVQLMNNTWKVIGNYNTPYNVSIEATLCDRYSKVTNILLLHGQ